MPTPGPGLCYCSATPPSPSPLYRFSKDPCFPSSLKRHRAPWSHAVTPLLAQLRAQLFQPLGLSPRPPPRARPLPPLLLSGP